MDKLPTNWPHQRLLAMYERHNSQNEDKASIVPVQNKKTEFGRQLSDCDIQRQMIPYRDCCQAQGTTRRYFYENNHTVPFCQNTKERRDINGLSYEIDFEIVEDN